MSLLSQRHHSVFTCSLQQVQQEKHRRYGGHEERWHHREEKRCCNTSSLSFSPLLAAALTFCGKPPFGENLRDNPSPWPNIRPSKGKWTANWSTLLHWSSAAMRRNELLLSELLERILNALSARCPGLEGPERCLVAESPKTSSTLIIRPSAGLFTFSPHADHVSSSS